MSSVFRAGKYSLPLGNFTYIMGILNITPDSFSDGGQHFHVEDAVARGLEIQNQGANLLDVGAQSTRPGHQRIGPEEEWARLSPVLEALRGKVTIPVSVDTFYPQVAAQALKAGADIINDVTGFTDPAMLEVAANSQDCGLIVMHNTAFTGPAGNFPWGNPQDFILTRVFDFFKDRLDAALKAGISQERLCFDPGVGFGKTYDENLCLLANVSSIKIEGCAFLMAASRKRVIGEPCGNPPFEQRLPGTVAAHTLAVEGGADILRVHDVAESVQAARVADAVLHWRPALAKTEKAQ